MIALQIALAVAAACAGLLAAVRLWRPGQTGATRRRVQSPEAIGRQMARELHMRRRTSYTDEHIELQARIVPGGWALKGGGAETLWHSLADLEAEVAHRVQRSRVDEWRVIPFPTVETAPPREQGPAGAA